MLSGFGSVVTSGSNYEVHLEHRVSDFPLPFGQALSYPPVLEPGPFSSLIELRIQPWLLSCVSSLRFDTRRTSQVSSNCDVSERTASGHVIKSTPKAERVIDMAPAGPRKPRCSVAHRRCASEARSVGVDLIALVGEMDCTADNFEVICTCERAIVNGRKTGKKRPRRGRAVQVEILDGM